MKRSTILKLLIVNLLAACGAPTKPASSVASLFLTADSLQNRMSKACDALVARTQAPTTNGMTLDLDGCQRAGQAALSYLEIESFTFVNIDGSALGSDAGKNLKIRSDFFLTADASSGASSVVPKTEVPLSNRKKRAQIWLNKSFLDLAGNLASFMKEKQDFNSGLVKLPNSASRNLENLANAKINILKKPTLDISNLSFSAQVEIKVSGIIKASQVLQIDGKLLSGSIAVVIRTVNPVDYSESIIRDAEFVVFITPYANDVYVDLYSSIDFYNIGLESVLDNQLNSFLSTGLKSMLDTLMVVRGKS